MSLLLALAGGGGGGTAYLLEIIPASYSVTGSAAQAVAALRADVTPGSYSYTGSNATTVCGLLTSTAPGTYAQTGSSATTAASLLTSTTPGGYSQTGSSASTARALLVNVTPASFAVSAEMPVLSLVVATVPKGGGGSWYPLGHKHDKTLARDVREVVQEAVQPKPETIAPIESASIVANEGENVTPQSAEQPRLSVTLEDDKKRQELLLELEAAAVTQSVMAQALAGVDAQLREAIAAAELDEDEAIALVMILAEA